jgi:hypothetical protein
MNIPFHKNSNLFRKLMKQSTIKIYQNSLKDQIDRMIRDCQWHLLITPITVNSI